MSNAIPQKPVGVATPKTGPKKPDSSPKTRDRTFLSTLATVMKNKAPGVVFSFPFDALGYFKMNNVYAGTGAPLSRLGTPVVFATASVEHLLHRGAKVGTQQTCLWHFRDRSEFERWAISTSSVAAVEVAVAPANRFAIKAQVGILNTFNDLKGFVLSGQSKPYKGSLAYGVRGMCFTGPQNAIYQGAERVFGKRFKDMSFGEQCATATTGVVGGSIGAAVATWANSTAGSKDTTMVQAMKSLVKDPTQPFNLRALLWKIGLKTPAHIVQYTPAITLLYLALHGENESK